jgi:hypothetical protein
MTVTSYIHNHSMESVDKISIKLDNHTEIIDLDEYEIVKESVIDSKTKTKSDKPVLDKEYFKQREWKIIVYLKCIYSNFF